MRRFVPLFTLLLATAACGGSEHRSEENLRTMDVSEETLAQNDITIEAAQRTPGIAPTAAPGVAFDYRYAFRLSSERIAAVQEQHAVACEKLGLTRCRITGFRYRVVGDREIEAILAFKLDPTIARQFGKAGADLVDQAEGMLVDAEITGTDAGAAIARANRTEAELNEALREIERQLARGGIPAYERARLQSEAQSLRQQLRANRAGRTDNEESLATTPMTFHYGSGELIPGFDTRSPIRAALAQSWENLVGGVATLLVILITLLPWAAVALVGWWIVRRLRGRIQRLGVTPEPIET